MRRPVTLAALALSTGLACSACGTGLHAQTYREVGRQDGANTDVASLAVRDLAVTGPDTGSTIPVDGTASITGLFANSGETSDALVSASSDAASTVTFAESGKPVTRIEVPARGASTATWVISLTGLTKPLAAGSYLNVTLTFAKAPRTTVRVPVRAGNNGLSERTPAQDPYKEG